MPQKFIQTIQFFNEKKSTRLSGKILYYFFIFFFLDEKEAKNQVESRRLLRTTCVCASGFPLFTARLQAGRKVKSATPLATSLSLRFNIKTLRRNKI